jgi:hypothetical protein
MDDAVGDAPVEHQNAFTAAIRSAMTSSLEQALYERMGDMWIIGKISRYLFPGPAMVERITRELLNFLSTEDYLQWWYYVPEDAWNKWKVFRHMAPVVQDVQLRRLIYMYRRLSFVGILLDLLAFVMHFCGVPFSKTWILFFVGSMTWIYAGGRTAKLRLDAFQYLTSKRSKVISALSSENREKEWSARTKALYAMTQGAFMLTGFATIGYLIYGACGDLTPSWNPPTSLKDVSILGRRTQDNPSGKPLASPKKEAEPVGESEDSPSAELRTIEVSTDESQTEMQNFIEVSDETLKKRDETINLWEQKVVQATMGYSNPTMTRQQFVSLAPKNLSAIFEKVEEEWVYKTNVFWVDTDICLVTEHDIPVKTVFWKIIDDEHHSSEHIVTVSPDDFMNYKDTGMAIGRIVHRNKKQMIRYLNNTPGQLHATFFHRSSNGILDDPIKVKGKRVVHSTTGVESIVWEWPVDTYAGACGGVYITDGDRNPAIVGVHYGCVMGNKRLGRSFLPSQIDVKNAVVEFVKQPEILLAGREPASWHNSVDGKETFAPSESPIEGGILDQAKWLLEMDMPKKFSKAP